MTTNTKSPEKSLLVKIAGKLVEAQQEIDELTVQLALGKAEARDKFEEVKKEFRSRVNELSQIISSDAPKEDIADVLAQLDELERLLKPDKAETKERFEAQKKKILGVLVQIEERIREKLLSPEAIHYYTHEFEKFKLMAEILRLKFVVRKFEVKDGFRTGMKTARKEIAGIINLAKRPVKKARKNYNNFSKEITQAYQQLKKAIKQA